MPTGLSQPSAAAAAALQMVQGTVSPRFNAASTYTDDYGVYNSDPLDHEAARAVDMTPCSTTYGMNAGTVRATRQLPGQRHMHGVAQPQGRQQLSARQRGALDPTCQLLLQPS